MKASFVDLRKKSNEIIRALNRNERVTVIYRGKPAATMYPMGSESEQEVKSAKDHPAFGLWADREDIKDVEAQIRQLRKSRFDAL
ncbi:MAG: hypothetical protein ACC645_10700 [Pirellulales bacterium]